jgi:hypothetical protein
MRDKAAETTATFNQEKPSTDRFVGALLVGALALFLLALGFGAWRFLSHHQFCFLVRSKFDEKNKLKKV